MLASDRAVPAIRRCLRAAEKEWDKMDEIARRPWHDFIEYASAHICQYMDREGLSVSFRRPKYR